MKTKEKIIIFIIIVIILYIIFSIVAKRYPKLFFVEEINDSVKRYLISIVSTKKPTIKINKKFQRKFTGFSKSYPYVAGIAVDINNNGKDEIFIGGGENQDDVLLSYKDGKMVDIIKSTGLSSKSPTYGGVSIDINDNGYNDMIIARDNGVFIYINNGNGTFSKKQILEKSDDTVPVAISVTDYDKDGNADIYVSNFIRSKYLKGFQFNNDQHSKRNILLRGDGRMGFRDVTRQTNTGGKHNTFTSIFTDLNNDYNPDLVLANDAGEIEILENKGNRFIKRKINTGFGFWMGIGAGDFDNDGDIDLFLSNIGAYNPEELGVTKGKGKSKLRSYQKLNHKHVLLRNDGNFSFTDVTTKYMPGKYGFGWGSAFADLNLDGKLDLLFSINYVGSPIHKYIRQPHPVLINKGNKFAQSYKYVDNNFGHTPLLANIDNDNIKDVVWINMKGPVKIYSNRNHLKNNFINVKLPDNIQFANAKVYLYYNNNKLQMRENIQGGVGFGSDQSNLLTFGLGKKKNIDYILVRTRYGEVYKYNNPKINSTLFVVQK